MKQLQVLLGEAPLGPLPAEQDRAHAAFLRHDRQRHEESLAGECAGKVRALEIGPAGAVPGGEEAARRPARRHRVDHGLGIRGGQGPSGHETLSAARDHDGTLQTQVFLQKRPAHRGDLLLAQRPTDVLLKRRERFRVIILGLEEAPIDPGPDPPPHRRVEEHGERQGNDPEHRGVIRQAARDPGDRQESDEQVDRRQRGRDGAVDDASADDDVDVEAVAHHGEGDGDRNGQLEHAVHLRGNRKGLPPEARQQAQEDERREADRDPPEDPFGLLPLPAQLELLTASIEREAPQAHREDEEDLSQELGKERPLPYIRTRIGEVAEQGSHLPHREHRGGDPQPAHEPGPSLEELAGAGKGLAHPEEKHRQHREAADPDRGNDPVRPRRRGWEIRAMDHRRDPVEKGA